MPGTVQFMEKIYRYDLQAARDTLFLFGDNLARKGLGGQAKEMRGEPNAIGVPTKAYPGRAPHDYFTPQSFDIVLPYFIIAFERAEEALKRRARVVLPSDGFGTGRAELETRAPQILTYIDSRIVGLLCLSSFQVDVPERFAVLWRQATQTKG
jgi:hypothetical protein